MRLITLPEYDVNRAVFFPDGIFFQSEIPGQGQLVPYKRIHGILAAPPCTMFSIARSTGGKRDLRGALGTVNSCLRVVQETLIRSYDAGHYGSLKFWAMENPKGYLDKLIGRPAFTFSPWMFGDPHFKNTHIWGFFKEPKQTPCEKPEKFDRVSWASPKAPAEYADLKLNRSGIRAITPPGFAQAFFKANR